MPLREAFEKPTHLYSFIKMNKTLLPGLTISILLFIIISCKKSETVKPKIEYLCLSDNLPSYNHQFGVKIDGVTYCSNFREIFPKIDKDHELKMYYLLSNSSNECCAGSIYFQTIGFRRMGISPLKILYLLNSDNKLRYEDFNNKIADGSINIVSISNGLVSGEFESKIVVNGKTHEIYGNFKDVPVENIQGSK